MSHSKNSKVSIVMPVRDASEFLQQCIDSILKQSFIDWELIAVNDHSTDNSQIILEKNALLDSRIKVYENKGKGIIDALRLALDKTSGELITRMDADDIMKKDKLLLMHNKLVHAGEGHVCTGFVLYFSETILGEGYVQYANWLNTMTSLCSNYDEIYKECVIPSPCWMVYKSDLNHVGGFDGIYPEDYDLCFRFRRNELKVIAVKEVIHLWRDYSNRTSRTDSNYADNSFLDLKLHHFIKDDWDKSKTLFLWGAGKRAKTIAQILLERDVRFRWICNNKKKINHNIYGVKMEEFLELNSVDKKQIILSVAQRGGKSIINDFLKQSLISKEDTYWFV